LVGRRNPEEKQEQAHEHRRVMGENHHGCQKSQVNRHMAAVALTKTAIAIRIYNVP
jgi:hypothetical protein